MAGITTIQKKNHTNSSPSDKDGSTPSPHVQGGRTKPRLPAVNVNGRWCSMSGPEVALWWDKDTDHNGRPIRPDVRSSAHRVWNCASKTAHTITGDGGHAAELMESTVAQVSRYLDRRCVLEFSREIDGLLMLSFRRALRRRLAKLRRIESLGGVRELSNRAIDRTWTRQIHAHLELEEIVRLLPERSRTILALRYAGYTWKESALVLGSSVAALRSIFWRDVARVKNRLKNGHSTRPESQFQRDTAATGDPRG